MVVEEVHKFTDKFTEKKGKFSEIVSQAENLTERKNILEEEIGKDVELRTKLEKSSEVMKKAIDILFGETLQNYKDLVTKALNDVFYPKEYEFDIELDSRGNNKTATMKFRQRIEGEWEPWRDMDNSCGGSLRAVVDFVTRVFIIAKTGRRRFVVMDETLSEIACEYKENMVELMNELSEQMGFDFLFVTHDDDYADLMEDVYRMENGRAEKE